MKNFERYLERARQLRIIPNFWLTKEYLSIQDIELRQNRKALWLQEGKWCIFPPLPLQGIELQPEDCPNLMIWSDFANYSIGEELQFLDWEYVYNADNFFDMSGKRWAVFRKNCRKWPRNNESWSYTNTPPSDHQITRLLERWLKYREEQEIADSESLLWFVFHGSRRAFLLRSGQLVGMNVWDENEPWLMYRYCLADPEEPFLDEFLRLMFYQSVPGKLVIDGGVLDNPGLERFKDKLNPLKKRPIYSRRI